MCFGLKIRLWTAIALHSLVPTLIKTPEQANQGQLQAGEFNQALSSNLQGNDPLGLAMRSPSSSLNPPPQMFLLEHICSKKSLKNMY